MIHPISDLLIWKMKIPSAIKTIYTYEYCFSFLSVGISFIKAYRASNWHNLLYLLFCKNSKILRTSLKVGSKRETNSKTGQSFQFQFKTSAQWYLIAVINRTKKSLIVDGYADLRPIVRSIVRENRKTHYKIDAFWLLERHSCRYIKGSKWMLIFF